jgi:GNAT superfamily N-acetyltransferase
MAPSDSSAADPADTPAEGLPIPGLTVRPASPADEEALFAVFVSSREREMGPMMLPPEMKERMLRLQYDGQLGTYAHTYPDARIWVLEMEGRMAGRLVLEYRRDEIWVVDIAILPGHRNGGIGGGMLRRLMAQSEASGRILRGSVTPYNPARELYRRLGVRELGPETEPLIPLEWRPPGL